ncbi:MAG: alpha-acetolactate decarboxylase [Flavobacteriaceae bacterium]|nr:alpha-acetolactate decarboxylase [Flavobacteriaceae bacterium]
MRNVMWFGDLEGKIATDSLSSNTAYGLGPIEYLKGEILLFEGQTFESKVIDSLQHKVEQTASSRAPFFVYSTASDLREINIPKEVFTLKSTENLIDSLYKDYEHPLLIRIDGMIDAITVHSVSLAEGSKVSSPDQAHQGLTKYDYENVSGSLIGFFSRKHKAVFTHHDSFFHGHFISDDRDILGHVDAIDFNSNKVSFSVSK